MGRPKKITPPVEKAPAKLAGSFEVNPDQQLAWDFFTEKLNGLAHTFGYFKIELPIVEDARLFKFFEQGSRDELLTFNDAKGVRVAVKPLGLFSLARMYLDYRMFERERVSKWFYVSPVSFVKNGQVVQNTEFGLETFGEIASIADAQSINLLYKLFSESGLGNLNLEINSVGCIECQPGFQEVVRNFLKEKKYDLCEESLEDLESNPLRILACPNLSCSAVVAEAPGFLDYLCDNCRRQFVSVLEGLDELRLAYNLNPKVIGRPWSRRTVFEIRYLSQAGDIVLGAGGHFDDLIQSLGGPVTPAFGFSGLAEGVLCAFDALNIKFSNHHKVDVFLVPLGELASKKTLRLFTELWNHNIMASEFIGQNSIKTQLKLAESNKVSIALIMGQKEARDGTVILRDVRSGMQELFTMDRIIEEVKKRLEK